MRWEGYVFEEAAASPKWGRRTKSMSREKLGLGKGAAEKKQPYQFGLPMGLGLVQDTL
jgi:hypothetical protein